MAAMDIPLVLDAVAPPQPRPAAESKQKPVSKPAPQPLPISPSRSPYANFAATSPAFRSSSPRLQSPASSEIFERSVQEPIAISEIEGEPRAHLATHVITEDHIPPALEASAQAITSQELNPDEVEIVTATAHQTAAASVLEGSTSQLDVSQMSSPTLSQRTEEADSVMQSGLLPPSDEEGPSYGSIDPNDVRRLSFISFADIVHAEHQHPPVTADAAPGPTQSSTLTGSAISPVRSRSPFRTIAAPSSNSGLTTPPLSAARHIIGSEQSPARSGTHGELTIETMRQAVRKTASGDIGANFRAPALSPTVSAGDAQSGLRSRTDS